MHVQLSGIVDTIPTTYLCCAGHLISTTERHSATHSDWQLLAAMRSLLAPVQRAGDPGWLGSDCVDVVVLTRKHLLHVSIEFIVALRTISGVTEVGAAHVFISAQQVWLLH